MAQSPAAKKRAASKKRSTSPKKRSTSPKKRSTSPKKRAASPKKRSTVFGNYVKKHYAAMAKLHPRTKAPEIMKLLGKKYRAAKGTTSTKTARRKSPCAGLAGKRPCPGKCHKVKGADYKSPSGKKVHRRISCAASPRTKK